MLKIGDYKTQLNNWNKERFYNKDKDEKDEISTHKNFSLPTSSTWMITYTIEKGKMLGMFKGLL